MKADWKNIKDIKPAVTTEKEKFPVMAITVIGITAPVYYYGKTKETDPCKGWSIAGVTHWDELPDKP